MGAIGSIWAWLMMLAGIRVYLDHLLPPDFAYALILSGLVALPFLFSRKVGLFGAIAPSGVVRGALAVSILTLAVAAHLPELFALAAHSA